MLRFSKKVEDATNISSSYLGNFFHSSFYPVQSLRDSRFTASGGKDWGDARRLLGGQLAQPDDARQPVLHELVIRYHRAVGQRPRASTPRSDTAVNRNPATPMASPEKSDCDLWALAMTAPEGQSSSILANPVPGDNPYDIKL
jgi:hypothetical protein